MMEMEESDLNGAVDDGYRLPRAPKEKKKTATMSPLEMAMDEEDYTSLIHETGDYSGIESTLTMRKKAAGAASSISGRVVYGAANVLGLLRNGTASAGYVIRNALMLATMGILAFLLIDNMNSRIEEIEQPMEAEHPRGVHQSSFGGIYNLGQQKGARAHQNHNETLHSIFIPVSNVGQHVPSIHPGNVLNHNGHYWHDPNSSPFASHLYNLDNAQLNKEAEDFEIKKNRIANKYGAWNLTDQYFQIHNPNSRPKVNFKNFSYNDAPLSAFPQDSWQSDQEYVEHFLAEAKALVGRVREGIYTEYGYASEKMDDTGNIIPLTDKQKIERNELFRVILDDFVVKNGKAVTLGSERVLKGIAHMNRNAWEGLIKKLLHKITTSGDFFIVMAGDGAASGRSNNFFQSSVMASQYLMEPVFDFFNVRLITRNMATSSVSSATIGALGGADIFGEADIMIWNSEEQLKQQRKAGSFDNTKYSGQYDLFNKQQIMSGDNVPLLLTPVPGQILHDSDGLAWTGNLQEGSLMCDEMTAAGEKEMPPACQHVRCPEGGKELCEKYDSVCWVPRRDYNVTVKQKEHVDIHEKDPNTKQHRLEGRKLSLLLLHALDAAFDQWSEGMDKYGAPLREDYWHVGDIYQSVQESVRTFVTKEGKAASACEELFRDFPIVCHVEMHANTEWTPNAGDYATSLRGLLRADMSVYSPPEQVAYTGIDILPPAWKSDGWDTDVHAIAIATTATPLDLNCSDDGNSNSIGSDSVVNGADGGDRGRITVESGHSAKLYDRRKLVDNSTSVEKKSTKVTELVPGKGWEVYNPTSGFCDGSSQSSCNRTPDSTCLLAGHNEGKAGLIGDALSGWLILTVPKVKEGVILARFDLSLLAYTKEHTNGPPKDFEFDYAINGMITTIPLKKFMDFEEAKVVDNLPLWPLLLDEEMAKQERKEDDDGENIEVAVRIRSDTGQAAKIILTHIYYA